MAKSFLGYVPREEGSDIIDWSKLAGGLSSSIDMAIGTRQRERELFENQTLSNEEKINSYELGKNQTVNDLIMNGSDDARSVIWEWNNAASEGKMTQSEFKRRQNNLMTYWGSFSNATKTFDQRFMEGQNRQASGEGSTFENYMNEQHAELGDLRNKKVYVNKETGAVYLAKYDENGNIISQVDVRQINNPGNSIDNRLDLDKTINETVETWGDWTQFVEGPMGSSSTVTDARINEVYIPAKNSLIDGILTGPRAIAGVLVDNSPDYYTYYSTNAEKNEIINKRLNIEKRNSEEMGKEFSEDEFLEDLEKRLILVERDEIGVYQPVITEDQRKAAEEIISNKIEMQVGHKESGTTKRAPSRSGGSGGSGGGADDGSEYAVYPTIKTAWENGDADLLNTVALDGNYKFELDKSGGKHGFIIKKYRGTSNGKVTWSKIGVAKSARELSRYIYKAGTSKGEMVSAESQFDKEKAAYLGRGDGPSKPPKKFN